MQQGYAAHPNSAAVDEVCVVDLAMAIYRRLVVRAQAHGAIGLHLEDDYRQVRRRRVDGGCHIEVEGWRRSRAVE